MTKPASELCFRLSSCEKGDLQAESQFKVSLYSTVFPSSSIDVQRNYAQIANLLRELRGDTLKESFDSTGTERESVTPVSLPDNISVFDLEKCFNDLLSTKTDLVDEPWNNLPLISFLDDAPSPSFLTTSAFVLMTNKIKALDQEAKKSQQMVAELQHQFKDLSSQFQSLLQTLPTNTATLLNNENPANNDKLVETKNNQVQVNNETSRDIQQQQQHQLQQQSDDFGSSLTTSPTASSTALTNSTETVTTNPLSKALSTTTTTCTATIISKFNPTAPTFNPKNSSLPTTTLCAPPVTTVVSTSTSDSLPSSTLLSSEIYAKLNTYEVLNETSMDFVTALCPQNAQVQYRDSVVGLLQRNFRLALNCEALEVGLHRLLCFLPDDPIKVSAVLCRNHATRWHRVICDRLNLIAKKRAEDSIIAHESYTYRSDHSEEIDDCTGDHVIRNVLISNSKISIHVQCSIDNTEVELSCNSRSEVCMLVLLEEISTLVGKNDLFKHSLMLIRAWWCCETAAYVGTTVKNYLSDFALCVMVAAIFNMHHTELHTPLQALCAFLAEYSTYDGSTSAISIMGIVPFKSTSSNQPVLPAPINPLIIESSDTPTENPSIVKCLLSRDILERYWLLYCPPDPSNPEQQHVKILPSLSSSSEDVMGYDVQGIANVHAAVPTTAVTTEQSNNTTDMSISGDGATTTNTTNIPNTTQSLEDIALSTHRQQCSRNMVKFDRSQFNIVDPFTCSNMVLERPSQNRIMRLSSVFQSGAIQMNDLLTQLMPKSKSLQDCQSLFKSFFPMATLRFIDTSSRPDTFNTDTSQVSPTVLTQMITKIPMNISLDELSRQMRYCNLMIESVISRTAILDLVVEILTQKGPLPIGEVGKALAELTCITGLSARLKEAYGGLKKFLEDYSSVVIIGTDHPFNPHIVLRSSLSSESLALNDSGVFPTHAVLKMKKVTASSSRKNAFSTSNKPAPPMSSSVPQHQGYRAGAPMVHGGGIGMNTHASDPRSQQRSMNVYSDPRMNTSGGYGNANNAPPQSYTSKFLSNLQAEARDREQMQRAMMQQHQQQSPQVHHHHQQRHQQGPHHFQQQSTHHLHQQQQPPHPPPPLHQHQQYQSLQVQDHTIRQDMERHGSATSIHSGGQSSFNRDGGAPGGTFISGPNSLASSSNDAFDEICNAATNISPTSSYGLHGQARNSPRFFGENNNGAAVVYDGSRMRTNTSGEVEVDEQSTSSRSRVPSYSSLYGGQVSRNQQALSGYDRGGITMSPNRERDPTPLSLSNNTNRYSNDSFFESSSQSGLEADPYGNNTISGGMSFNRSAGFPNKSNVGSSGIHLSPPQYQSRMTEQSPRTHVGTLLSGLREGTVELVETPRDCWDNLYAPQQQHPHQQQTQTQYDFMRQTSQEWL